MDLDYRTWETLPTEPCRVVRNGFGLDGSTITIKRDRDYRLVFRLECSITQYTQYRLAVKSRRRKMRLICTTEDTNKQIFIPRLLIQEESSGRGAAALAGEVLELYQYYRGIPQALKASRKQYKLYYLLNAPNRFPFPKSVTYEKRTSVLRIIEDFAEEAYDDANLSHSDRSCLILQKDNKRAAFVKTMLTGSGEASMYVRVNCSAEISYDDLIRIVQFLGFLTGTSFFYLGHAEITTKHNKHKQYHRSSLEKGIASKLSSSPYGALPFNYSAWRPDYDATAEIQHLLDAYIDVRDEFSLDAVLAMIQNARHTPPLLQIQPLSAAYDILKTQWFKSDRSKSKGKFMNDERFGQVVQDCLKSIRNDLGEIDGAAMVVNNILKANNFSLGAMDQGLFRELGLEYGEIERFAFKIRNRIVHGSFPKDSAIVEFANRAYYAILNRLILHLLGGCEYIDFTTSLQLIRPTIHALGGPEDDGRPPKFESMR